jgi:ParB family chromosome partitioning protein
MMDPKEIKTHPTFESLFSIREDVLQRIEEDMRANKFDQSQPVILANWEGQDEFVCIDGHTRLQAAIRAGIEEIPVWIKEDFDTEGEVLKHAMKLQANRRNMTDAELMSCIEALDEIRPRGGDRRSEQESAMPQSCGKESGRSASAKDTAQIVGCSPRKVEQVRTVMKHADHDTQEAVKNGEMSVNRAYSETQKRRKEAKAAESTSESAPEETQTEVKVVDDEQDSEEETETSQQEASDRVMDIDDRETDPDEPGPVQVQESEDSASVIGDDEQADEVLYVNIKIRLDQAVALHKSGLTPEEAIDQYLEHLKPIDDHDRREYEEMWANSDDDDEGQDDVPEVDAA